MTACDTGFFVEYLNANARAADVLATTDDIVLSVISLYELRRLALKGVTDANRTDTLLTFIPKAFQVIYLDSGCTDLLTRSARLAHGNGLSMADSLIMASALSVKADVLYTTDSDMARYKGEGPKVVML